MKKVGRPSLEEKIMWGIEGPSFSFMHEESQMTITRS
jgi:hypothetical protein